MTSTPQMNELRQKFIEEGLTESSANAYISRLKTLNNIKPFKTLAFLRKTEDITLKLSPYALSTQKAFCIAIVKSLSYQQNTPQYGKCYKFYYDLLKKYISQEKELEEKHTLSPSQEKAWISWDEVLTKFNDLEKIILAYEFSTLNQKQFQELLKTFVLSLYVLNDPRRNKDYHECYIINKYSPELPTDKNYLSLEDEKFVFNVYKTAKYHEKKRGTPTEELCFKDNTRFKTLLSIYLKYHPCMKPTTAKKILSPLLCYYDGSSYRSINVITKILNSIFGVAIGCSMLRHIYLTYTSKDDIDKLEKKAHNMSHSLETQRKYIKKIPVGDDDASADTSSIKEEHTPEGVDCVIPKDDIIDEVFKEINSSS